MQEEMGTAKRPKITSMSFYEATVKQGRVLQGDLSKTKATYKAKDKTKTTAGKAKVTVSKTMKTTFKKVKSSVKKTLELPKIDKDMQKLRKKWLKLKPDGCSKCRHNPGCTPSCWMRRK